MESFKSVFSWVDIAPGFNFALLALQSSHTVGYNFWSYSLVEWRHQRYILPILQRDIFNFALLASCCNAIQCNALYIGDRATGYLGFNAPALHPFQLLLQCGEPSQCDLFHKIFQWIGSLSLESQCIKNNGMLWNNFTNGGVTLSEIYFSLINGQKSDCFMKLLNKIP